MKHVTIKDIAQSLHISVSTVSRALTDDKNIRRETREAVLREAERLGYHRNPVALNLKTGRTNTIGVIVPEMHTPYASQVVAGIQSILFSNNQKVVMAESDEDHEREGEHLKMMEDFMVDGLIVSICSYKHNVDTYHRLAKEGMAMVVGTHEMGFAREVGNRVLFMADGKLLVDGTPEEIFENPTNPRLQEFLSKVL